MRKKGTRSSYSCYTTGGTSNFGPDGWFKTLPASSVDPLPNFDDRARQSSSLSGILFGGRVYGESHVSLLVDHSRN